MDLLSHMFASSDDEVTDCHTHKTDVHHLNKDFALISLKRTHVQNVQSAGSVMEGNAIISPPIMQPGQVAEMNADVKEEIWLR